MAANQNSSFELGLVPLESLDAAMELEIAGYPEDEAASRESFHLRLTRASNLFLGLWACDPGSERRLIGYACATRTSSSVLEEESMRRHEDQGETVCIHSVCIHKDFRRKGHALSLLKSYIEHVRTVPGVKRLLLISHEELLPLYTQAGFVCRGPSKVHHGARPWFECALEL
eukprot:m.9938 g.9938  ORF g.9938 m.9938 type:complete len:172 (+) comp5506_c0_seq1:12-527(+)